MCFNSKKHFIKNFKQFENNLPDIKEESINFPLKKLIYIIKEKIDGTIKEGENKYILDFTQEKSLPIKFNLIINYTIDEDTDYSGYIDYNEIKRVKFNNFNLYIDIKDKEMDYSSVYSTIGHELKHVFDIYHNDPYQEVNKMKVIWKLHENTQNKYLREILYLTYLSLSYELEARNNELYNKLRWLKSFDSSMIMDEFKKTYIYESLMMLKNFDIDDILNNVNNDELTVFLIDYANKIYGREIVSPKNFLERIKGFFNAVGDAYLTKANDILEELIRDNRPYMETLKHPFFYEYLYLFNLEKEMEEIIEKINLA